ncbi:hypothetical protein AAHA92_26086 [Salvia divinorum]|uniref:DUF4408 domain-containing protein n=1 Tax=Salvia divinorum TaxID=28513 RepID=A0ABD1GFC6_SALDI
MPFLFVDSLAKNNSRFVQISCKILELLLLSMGLVSTTVVLKDALNLPGSCKVIFSTVVGLWSSIKGFLSTSPTTITVVAINLMVLLIFASSALHRRQHPESTTTTSYVLGHVDIDRFDIDLEFQIDHDHDLDHDHGPDQSPLILEPPPLPPPSAPPIWDVIEVTPQPPPSDVARPILIRDSNATNWYDDVSNQDNTSTAVATIYKWKGVLIVETAAEERESTDQEEDNTIDATWEAITGGGKTKARKKSETWEAPPQRRRRPRRLDSEEVVPTSPKWKDLRKAETFNDAVTAMRRGGLVRRVPSMSLEEFNQKVERFIKKFKDGIRLQRQESDQRFLDIINQRG